MAQQNTSIRFNASTHLGKSVKDYVVGLMAVSLGGELVTEHMEQGMTGNGSQPEHFGAFVDDGTYPTLEEAKASYQLLKTMVQLLDARAIEENIRETITKHGITLSR